MGPLVSWSPQEGLPYRKIPRPLWEVPLLKAMFSAATEAWDREQMEQVVSTRTVSIPTHGISTTNFGLTKTDALAEAAGVRWPGAWLDRAVSRRCG